MKLKNSGLACVSNGLIYIGMGLGALFWVLESSVHVYVFDDGTLVGQIFFPAAHEAWMRAFVVGLLFIFGAYAQRIMKQRKQVEDSLNLAHAELNQIFNVAVPLCVIDKDHIMMRVNDTFCSFIGLKRDEILGKKCHDVCEYPLCHTQECLMTQILGGMEQSKHEIDKKRGDGRAISFVVTAIPYRGINGELLGIVEHFADITDRKKA
ncbi:MAG: PAS domain-containing protein, partial [Deltaproteobacteria bacterium]|nr:PAS domain-containing protein [Deltaproteobacteria bacterium]